MHIINYIIGYCREYVASYNHRFINSSLTSVGCITIGGPAKGQPCVFPFIFEGVSTDTLYSLALDVLTPLLRRATAPVRTGPLARDCQKELPGAQLRSLEYPSTLTLYLYFCIHFPPQVNSSSGVHVRGDGKYGFCSEDCIGTTQPPTPGPPHGLHGIMILKA